MQKQCAVCLSPFNAAKSRVVTCSVRCGGIYRRRENSPVERACPGCGKSYEADPVRLRHGRETTCSRACSYKVRSDKLKTEVVIKCALCNRQFPRQPAHVKREDRPQFCTRECHYAARRLGVIDHKPYRHTDAGLASQSETGALAYASGATVAFPKVEVAVAARLAAVGLLAMHQQVFRRPNGTAIVVDFFFPALAAVAEIDGKSHRGQRQRERDRERDEFLAGIGIRVIRVEDRGGPDEVYRAMILALAG